jgi:hypothetical protein
LVRALKKSLGGIEMTDLEQHQYDAFFDELSQIEKKAMLEKVALGVVGQTIKGFSRIARRGLAPSAQRMQRAFTVGAGRAKNLGTSSTLGGLGSVLRTREGKATAAALGAGALGAGGAGYAASRLGNRQT